MTLDPAKRGNLYTEAQKILQDDSMLSGLETDLAVSTNLKKFAYQAFETAGYLDRLSSINNNLGAIYAQLGLYSRAIRFFRNALEIVPADAVPLSNMVHAEIELSALDLAHQHSAELSTLHRNQMDLAFIEELSGRIALLEEKQKIAIKHFKRAIRISHAAGLAREIGELTLLGQAYLTEGNVSAALKATSRAARMESYALFSEAAAEASRLTELAFPLVPHAEVYEHLGEVKMQVLDLRKVWEREQEKRRFTVAPEEAWLTFEWDAPVPPFLVWEYLTSPRLEQQWAGYDLVERTDSRGGRFTTGTTYHCAHGDVHFFNKILDWKSFEYVSLEQNINIGIKLVQTRYLQETPTGTKIVFHIRKPDSAVPEELKHAVVGAYNQAAAGLEKQLE